MIDFLCSILGVSYSGLGLTLQTIILASACVICLIILDCIIRFISSPIFALMGRLNSKS